ncbi:hypothetical protein CANINC_002822 [Pichia inconspicua]|uniref:Pre-mRNA-splicing factor ISY1 n=1 Tax=Pichia inconspicua TaxID=52247 RepID=A0A4T0X0B1_9ASCO|nr:hypothetical protein CANINC_002822 [[Candida] inconspicua]
MAPSTNNLKESFVSKKQAGRKFGRPSTKSCNKVEVALQHRAAVVSELSSSLAKINDPLLTEYQIRDLNDKINLLLKERRAWEYRIKELGGPDFRKQIDTNDSFSLKGYKYFGRARELPDVVKLIEEVTLKRSNDKNAVQEKKRRELFDNNEHWTDYHLNIDRNSPIFDVEKGTKLLSFNPSKTTPVTQDLEAMKQFLIKEKKKYLLMRIRMQK